MNDKPSIVVGIPAFNEERTIAGVVLQAQRFVNRVVVCDDGSMSMLAEMVSRNALKMRLSLYLLDCSLA